MSRGLDYDRADLVERTPDRQVDTQGPSRIDGVPTRGLTLPRDGERERVEFRGREYYLNGAQTRALATVGPFASSPRRTSTTARTAACHVATGVT